MWIETGIPYVRVARMRSSRQFVNVNVFAQFDAYSGSIQMAWPRGIGSSCTGLRSATANEINVVGESRSLSISFSDALWLGFGQEQADEEARYLAAAPPLLASVATVLFDAGLRPDEAFRLRWEAIAWVNGRCGDFLVTHGKTAAARRLLPMTPRVRAALETRWHALKCPIEGWVFPAPTRSGHIEAFSLLKQHRRALRVSEVRRFVLYSIRHTFLTRLGASGCDAWTLARIAGHSNIAMSNRYVHPPEDAVLAAMERLGGHKIGHNDAGATSTHTIEKAPEA